MKEWTIMVYMSGDNNLSIDMAYALQEIREVAKEAGEKINLLVYHDSLLQDVPTSYYDFSDYDEPLWIASKDAPDKFAPPEDPQRVADNENSARAYSVLNFIDWCLNKVKYTVDGATFYGRKANNYAFIFSGHSFGFQDIGLFKDESANSYMTLNKLSWVFERVAETEREIDDGKPVILGEKLGILGFDSCVMSMLEVGCAFYRGAEAMIASEGTIPNAGWTYRQLIERIAASPKNGEVRETAITIVHEFINSQNKFTIGGVSVDIAAWNLEKVPAVVGAFEKLVDELLACIADDQSTVYKQIKRILLQVHWDCQTYMYEQNVDLMDFCRLLYREVESLENELGSDLNGTTARLRDSCFAVMKSIDECVILSGFCGGNYQYSNGISLFFPWTLSSYLVSMDFYTGLRFFEIDENIHQAGKKWNEFLIKYLAGVTYRQVRAPESARTGVEGAGSRTADRLGTLSEAEIILNSERIPPGIKNKLFSHEKIKIPAEIEGKIPASIKSRIPPNLRDRIPPNLRDRIPPNLRDRIPPNLRDRIPPNLRDRIFGGMAIFMEQFTKFKNIDTPWFISGFTKKIAHRDKKKE